MQTTTQQSFIRRLGPILLTIFIDILGFSLIFPLFPAMLQWYTLQEGLLGTFLGSLIDSLQALTAQSQNSHWVVSVLFGGIVGSLYSIGQFICAPLWGRLSDRIGRRPVLKMTVIGLALSYAFWMVSDSFAGFLMARLIGGCMAGNMAVANAAAADLTTGENRARGMALVGIAFGFGFIIGPAIGGFLSAFNILDAYPELARYGLHPFSVPAFGALCLSLINVIWVWLGFKETYVTTAQPAFQMPLKERLLGMFKARQPELTYLNAIYFLFLLVFSGMELTLAFVAVERFAYTARATSWIYVVVGITMFVVQGSLARSQRLRGRELQFLGVGLGIGMLAYMGIAVSVSSQVLFYVSIILLGVCSALCVPMLLALVSLKSPSEHQGHSLGLFRSAGALARVFGPLLAAVLYFYYGAQLCYWLAGASVILPGLLMLRLRKT